MQYRGRKAEITMNSKMSMAWHKECLNNTKASAERAAVIAAREKETADRLAADVAFYEKQIAAAEAAGKDGFDRDRFMKGKA